MKTILIADDRLEVLELLRVTLEAEDYQVIYTSDGKEALEKIKLEKPDLILLDVVMPKMDGFQVLSELRRDSRLKDTPVIMLTAKGQEVDREKGKKLGANDYIVKPFSPSELLTKVGEILG